MHTYICVIEAIDQVVTQVKIDECTHGVVVTVNFFLFYSIREVILCQHPFTQYLSGCYLPGSGKRSWLAAEQDCHSYGGNVHLATPNTAQVSSLFS